MEVSYQEDERAFPPESFLESIPISKVRIKSALFEFLIENPLERSIFSIFKAISLWRRSGSSLMLITEKDCP